MLTTLHCPVQKPARTAQGTITMRTLVKWVIKILQQHRLILTILILVGGLLLFILI